MKPRLIIFMSLMLLPLGSCRKENEEPQAQAQPVPMPMAVQTQAMPALHTGVIQEVLQATEYTYLNLREGDQTTWIAVRKADFQVGDTLSFNGGLEMRDFTSKDLDRTFARVLFVDQISQGGAMPAMPSPHEVPTPSGKPVLPKQEVAIEPLAGGVTIGDLFSQRQTYAGQIVTVKGQVTKVNRGIMGKNWIHLQDGTESNGEFDLTLTTQDDAEVGDIAVFAGTLTLNKDFGAGYKYDVIVENAQRAAD